MYPDCALLSQVEAVDQTYLLQVANRHCGSHYVLCAIWKTADGEREIFFNLQ
jgi:hypothetical protein